MDKSIGVHLTVLYFVVNLKMASGKYMLFCVKLCGDNHLGCCRLFDDF